MVRTLAACVLVLAPLSAQISDGPLLACPVHLTVAPNTLGPGGAALPTNELYLKRAGFHDLAPAAPFAPTRPDFSMDAMFGAGRPPDFRLDAISSDNCKVFCTWDAAGDPVLQVPAGNWGALLFSVTRGTSGGTTAAVGAEAARPDGPGADLFSLVLPGSTLPSALDCVPIGEAQRASDSGEMGFQTLAGQRPEMLDFDPYFSFYETEGVVIPSLPADPWVFFSVPNGVAPMVAAWFSTRNGVPIPAPGNTPSGATILRTRWQSTAPVPYWTPPQVFLTWEELGLFAPDDIDALAVDRSGVVLLSLRRTPARNTVEDQLMAAGFASSGGTVIVTRTARPYYYHTSADTKEPLGKIAGAGGGGDVDGTCEIDPGNANGTPAIAFGYIVACRTDLPFPVTMGASAMAARPVAAGLSSYAISVSGLPASGLACLLVGFPAPGGGPVVNATTLGFYLLPATVMTKHWSMPYTLFALGCELDFQWAAFSGPGMTLARTARLRI